MKTTDIGYFGRTQNVRDPREPIDADALARVIGALPVKPPKLELVPSAPKDALASLSHNEFQVLELFKLAAARGDACPTNRQIAEHVGRGYTASRAGQWLAALAGAGLVAVESIGTARRVTIVESGATVGAHPRDIFNPPKPVTATVSPMKAALTGSEQRVLALMEAAANRGLPAPTNDQLAGRIGFKSSGSVSGVVKTLEQKGHIAVDRFRTWRRVTITATGKATATVGSITARHEQAVKPRETAPRKPEIVQAEPPRRVDRDPCGWCGVRRDIGCNHHPKGE